MKTMPCPACNKMISFEAATCPKCGHPITDEDRAAGAKFNGRVGIGCLTIVAIVVLFNLFSGSGEKTGSSASYQLQEPATPEAMPYVVLESSSGTVGSGGFLITEGSIQAIPTAYPVTEQMLADTTIKAAWEIRKETKASFVRVFLTIDQAHIGQGEILAQVDFSPRKQHADGSAAPTWDVTAVSKPISQDRWDKFPSEGLGSLALITAQYTMD